MPTGASRPSRGPEDRHLRTQFRCGDPIQSTKDRDAHFIIGRSGPKSGVLSSAARLGRRPACWVRV